MTLKEIDTKGYKYTDPQELTEEAWNTDYVKLLKERFLVHSGNVSYSFESYYEASKQIKKVGGLKGTGFTLTKQSDYEYPDGKKTIKEDTYYELDKLGNWLLKEKRTMN